MYLGLRGFGIAGFAGILIHAARVRQEDAAGGGEAEAEERRKEDSFATTGLAGS
jgi:hypothetical protein